MTFIQCLENNNLIERNNSDAFSYNLEHLQDFQAPKIIINKIVIKNSYGNPFNFEKKYLFSYKSRTLRWKVAWSENGRKRPLWFCSELFRSVLYRLTDTGEDSELVRRWKRSKENAAPPRYFPTQRRNKNTRVQFWKLKFSSLFEIKIISDQKVNKLRRFSFWDFNKIELNKSCETDFRLIMRLQ